MSTLTVSSFFRMSNISAQNVARLPRPLRLIIFYYHLIGHLRSEPSHCARKCRIVLSLITRFTCRQGMVTSPCESVNSSSNGLSTRKNITQNNGTSHAPPWNLISRSRADLFHSRLPPIPQRDPFNEEGECKRSTHKQGIIVRDNFIAYLLQSNLHSVHRDGELDHVSDYHYKYLPNKQRVHFDSV